MNFRHPILFDCFECFDNVVSCASFSNERDSKGAGAPIFEPVGKRGLLLRREQPQRHREDVARLVQGLVAAAAVGAGCLRICQRFACSIVQATNRQDQLHLRNVNACAGCR